MMKFVWRAFVVITGWIVLLSWFGLWENVYTILTPSTEQFMGFLLLGLFTGGIATALLFLAYAIPVVIVTALLYGLARMVR